MAQAEVFDVAVVGLGPVGATLALQLSHEGFRVAVVDRVTEPAQLPRAVNLDGETLRSFERIGFAEEVAGIVQPPRDPHKMCFTDSKRNEIFGLDLPPIGPMGFCDVNFFDQPEFERLLRRLISDDPRIELRLGCEVTSIEQNERFVELRSEKVGSGGGEGAHIRASWLVGCDGASSFVRSATGIPWKSLGYDQDWLVIDVIEKPSSKLPLATMQVCDPARLTTYVCVRDPRRRWEFQLLPGETREEMEHPDKIAELLEPWAAPDEYELERVAVYQFHAATAERWREGRVFLAGDAAHQTPPFLGQGLNAGLRDAANLAWKLAWVRDGRSSPALLDRYFEERDPHARKLVEGAVGIGQLMEFLAAKEAGLEASPPQTEFGPNGPVAPTLLAGVVIDEQTAPHGPAGALFSQPTLQNSQGERIRGDRPLGEGFAVVARRRSDLALSPQSEVQLERLGVPLVALDEFEGVEGLVDRSLEEHPAVVVRPDRYVFGVVDERWSLDALVAALVEKLALRGDWIAA